MKFLYTFRHGSGWSSEMPTSALATFVARYEPLIKAVEEAHKANKASGYWKVIEPEHPAMISLIRDIESEPELTSSLQEYELGRVIHSLQLACDNLAVKEIQSGDIVTVNQCDGRENWYVEDLPSMERVHRRTGLIISDSARQFIEPLNFVKRQ